MNWIASLIFSSLLIGFSTSAKAQILPKEDQNSGLEDLYDKFEDQENQQKVNKKEQEKRNDGKAESKGITKLSELVELSPFQDIAVIQKRYLPKTSRFEISSSALMTTNNAFFNDLGLGLRMAYFFQEKYGIEATYLFLTSSDRPITTGLFDNQKVSTKSVVKPESFYGLSFKWIPVYGKMAWFQEKIIPFDVYFTPGFGLSNNKSGSDSTVSMGLGQLFALSKSYGVRWDFTWNFYQAEVQDANGQTSTQSHSDLYLGIGMSFFFPEATYR